jgi:hypothetical protein
MGIITSQIENHAQWKGVYFSEKEHPYKGINDRPVAIIVPLTPKGGLYNFDYKARHEVIETNPTYLVLDNGFYILHAESIDSEKDFRLVSKAQYEAEHSVGFVVTTLKRMFPNPYCGETTMRSKYRSIVLSGEKDSPEHREFMDYYGLYYDTMYKMGGRYYFEEQFGRFILPSTEMLKAVTTRNYPKHLVVD